jgi:hypothetical protein
VNGTTKITFDSTKAEFCLEYPLIAIKGLLKGERYFNIEKEAFIYSKNHNLFANMIFYPKVTGISGWFSSQPAKDTVVGSIYQVNSELITQKFLKNKQPRSNPDFEKLGVKELAKIEGRWT